MAARTRFYRQVTVQSEDGVHHVFLDGKPIRTPAGQTLELPSRPLAEAVADEWRAQDKSIHPETMMLTKLANTAIDRVAPDREAVIAQILAFAKSDLLCYRAERPQDLVERQAAIWDPLLAWARERCGAKLTSFPGIAFVEQPPGALAALARAINGYDDFALAALHNAATLSGSAIVALALSEGQLDAEQAYQAAELEAAYQAERWGQDPEALMRSRRKAAELTETERFLRVLRMP